MAILHMPDCDSWIFVIWTHENFTQLLSSYSLFSFRQIRMKWWFLLL